MLNTSDDTDYIIHCTMTE